MNERIPLAVPISLEFKDGRRIGTFEINLPYKEEGWSLNSMRDWIQAVLDSDRIRKEELKVLDAQNFKLRCAIDSEPELPGEMPDEIWEKVKNDREALTELLKITVRKTKEGILTRARSK